MEQDPNAPPQAKRVGKASNAAGMLIWMDSQVIRVAIKEAKCIK